MTDEASRSAETINLDQLISISSKSAIRSFRELELDKGVFKPRIWVGIWIDPYGPGDIGFPGGVGPGQ